MMNDFGNNGGFDNILNILENVKAGKDIDVDSFCYLSTMISMPISLWHRDWIEEYAERFANAIRQQLLNLDDQSMRANDKNAYNQVFNCLNFINIRCKTPQQASEMKEVLSLSLCKRCLKSEFLDLRIKGMKELNSVILKACPLIGVADVDKL